MSSFRTALRTTLLAAVLVGGTLATVAPTDALVPGLAYSSNLYCSGDVVDVITFFNTSSEPIDASVTMVTSMQSTKKSVVVPANSTIDAMFTLSIGERLDKIVFRDGDDVVQYTMVPNTVITGTGSCFRQAFELLEMESYSLSCIDGVTHASVSINNSGDYPAELTATADAWFADAPSYSDALQAGLIFGDSETLLATPGSTRVFNLDFKIVDQFELAVRKGSTLVFGDGPRAMAVGEGCATGPVVDESTTTSSTIPDTTDPMDTTDAPDTTGATDTMPDTTSGPDTTGVAADSGSQAPGGTTTVPAITTLVAQDGRSLPVTGRSSLPVGLVGVLLFGAGLALVRTTRRSVR